MQIAESNDQKRKRKYMMLISKAQINEANNNNDKIEDDLSFELTQNNLFCNDLFEMPDKFMIKKFVVEFLKSDGVFIFIFIFFVYNF